MQRWVLQQWVNHLVQGPVARRQQALVVMASGQVHLLALMVLLAAGW
jgi:hypothetical protein